MKVLVIDIAHLADLNPDQLAAFATEYSEKYDTEGEGVEDITIEEEFIQDLIGDFQLDNRRGYDWRDKLVPESLDEAMDFERGQDPKDALGIGIPNVREIKKAFNFITPYIDKMVADEIDFRDFRRKVDELKRALDIIIVNHLNKKYDLGAKLLENPPQGTYNSIWKFADANVKDQYYFAFYKNGPGNGFWFKFNDGRDQYESKQSSKLSTLDQKLEYVIKKYNVPV